MEQGKNKLEVLYPSIGVEKGYIVEYKKMKNDEAYYERVAKEINLLSVNHNIDTGEISCNVSFDYQGNRVKAELQRADFTKTKILKLASLGADIFDHNATNIIKHLRNQEAIAPKVNVHQYLGWREYKGEEIFKHYHAVGIQSQYIGKLSIEPRGSLKNWLGLIKEEVLGHTPLELAVILGLSSVVVGYINKELGFDSLMVHICGNSTEGKTTACQLAVSAAGYPDAKEKGLMMTWNGTINAIMGLLKNNSGLPVVIDEASMSGIKDFTKVIYVISGGRDKERLTKELEAVEHSSWNTTIISNGEHALTSKSKQNIGIRMRLMEFSGVNWTKSAENAENIKKGVLENHGHAAPIMAEAIIKQGKEMILDKIHNWREKALGYLEDCDKFASRLTMKIGIIMATAEIANEVFDLSFDTEKILYFIAENETETSKTKDLDTNAYEYLLEQVNINKNKFSKTFGDISQGLKEIEDTLYEHWGKIDYGKGNNEKEINILPSVFHKFMEEGGFEDSKIILKKWKQKGLLNCEKDRLTRKRKIRLNGDSIEVYVVKVVEEPKAKIKKLPKKSPILE